MKTLSQLSDEHGSDKHSLHGYTDIFEGYLAPLRDKPIRLLEIGVLGGASLKMWRDYFPHGNIVGVDCDDKTNLDLGDRIQIWKGDASDSAFWSKCIPAINLFDFVVDDGRHSVYSIVKAFIGGMLLLKPGGLFIAEDCHHTFTADGRADNHLLGLPPNQTIIDYFLELAKTMQENGSGQTGKPISDFPIKFVHFYKSLVIVQKA